MGRVLHLTLKKKWFDMIASGEKKEEYREIKPYWEKRLWREFDPNSNRAAIIDGRDGSKDFDGIIFKNGYSGGAKLMTFKFESIEVREGRHEWGAEPGKKYFVIKLGEKL